MKYLLTICLGLTIILGISAQESVNLSILFYDGTKINNCSLDINEFELETDHGLLKIPCKDIKNIRLGYHCEEKLSEQINDNIMKLGNNLYKNREEAYNFLYKHKLYSYYPLTKFNKKNTNFESLARLNSLINKISEDESNRFYTEKKDSYDLVHLNNDAMYKGTLKTTKYRFSASSIGTFEPKIYDIHYIEITSK